MTASSAEQAPCNHDWVCSLCGSAATGDQQSYADRAQKDWDRQQKEWDQQNMDWERNLVARDRARQRQEMGQRLSDARLRATHEKYGTGKLLPSWLGNDDD
jgi:hypothetical protein